MKKTIDKGDLVEIDFDVITKEHHPWAKAYKGMGSFLVEGIKEGKETIIVLKLTEKQQYHFDNNWPQLACPELMHNKFLKVYRKSKTNFSRFYELYF